MRLLKQVYNQTYCIDELNGCNQRNEVGSGTTQLKDVHYLCMFIDNEQKIEMNKPHRNKRYGDEIMVFICILFVS